MSAALAWATVSARDASQHDLKAAALHAADMNRLSTHLRRRGHHMSVDTQKTVARALRYACKTACGPVSIERLNELSVQYLERPRTTRMTRNDVAHLVAAGIARRTHGSVEYCGKSKKHFVDLTVISGSAGQMENDFHAKTQQTSCERHLRQLGTKKTMVDLVPPLKEARCRQLAASLEGVDLDALDTELAELSIVSSPSAPTAFVEKEKKEKESRLSTAQPATQCMADCPDGASATLLGIHAASLASRRYRAEQRRAARRTASCEVRGSGHVTPPAMPSFKFTVAASRAATPCAASLTASPNTPQDELVDDETVPDEQLLSPATLQTNASMIAMLRPSHRRTSRLIALKRIREGLPAWETAEEASVDDAPTQRLSEAEARGFRAGSKTQKRDPFAGPTAAPRMEIAKHDDDDHPADAMWVRYAVALAPELSRLPFLPAARAKIAKKHWRAALAGLLYRPRGRVSNAAGFVARAAECLAAGEGRDARLSKWFTVQPGWPNRLAQAADCEERMAGWEPAAWGPQTYY